MNFLKHTLSFLKRALSFLKHALFLQRHILLALLIAAPQMGLRAEILIGRLIDSETKLPIESADIDMKNISSSSNIIVYGTNGKKTYYQTDSLGRFIIYGWDGAWALTFMQIGYKNAVRTQVCQGNNHSRDTINLGDIELKMSKALLKEIVIKGQRKKFYLHGDTVVYDPQAFNLKEGDRIERLLQKLPGVDRDANGNLSWMGKPLKMILNGQDNDVATRFLPNIAAEAVENIKLYKRRNGRDSLQYKDGEQVLDVKIKREWMEKWYGDASLLGQTPQYYDVNANGYRLSDKVPVYIFADMADGNHYYYAGGGGSGGTLSKDNNTRVKGHKLGLSASKTKQQQEHDKYLYYHSFVNPNLHHEDNFSRSTGKTEQFLTTGTNYSMNKSSNYSHQFGASPLNINIYRSNNKLTHRFDAGLQYNRFSSNGESSSATFNASPYQFTAAPLAHIGTTGAVADSLRKYAVNSSSNSNYSIQDSYNFNLNYGINLKLKKTNHLSMGTTLRYTDGNNKSYSLYNTKYYKESTTANTDKQYRTAPERNFEADLSLQYYHTLYNKYKQRGEGLTPVSKQINATITNRTTYWRNYRNEQLYRWIINDISTDDLMNQLQYLPTEYQELLGALDANNSTRKDMRTITNSPSLQISASLGKWNLTPTFELNIANEHLDYKRGAIDTTAIRTTLTPGLRLYANYRLGNATNFSLSTSYGTAQPDMLSQMAYVDNTNPLHIEEGNPNLRPTRHWRNTLSFDRTIARLQMMMRGSLSCNRSFNATSHTSLYDPTTGIYHSKRVNTRGAISLEANYTIQWFIIPKLKVQDETRVALSKNYSILNADITSPQQVLNAQRSRTVANTLNLTYFGDNLELIAQLHMQNRNFRNAARSGNDYNYWDYALGLKAKYLIANKWELNLALDYDNKEGYMSDIMNRDHLLVDLSLDWKILRNQGTITLGGSDIFKQYTSHYSYVGPNSRSENESLSLSHYYYVKFTYHFDGRRNHKPASRTTAPATSGTVKQTNVVVHKKLQME